MQQGDCPEIAWLCPSDHFSSPQVNKITLVSLTSLFKVSIPFRAYPPPLFILPSLSYANLSFFVLIPRELEIDMLWDNINKILWYL